MELLLRRLAKHQVVSEKERQSCSSVAAVQCGAMAHGPFDTSRGSVLPLSDRLDVRKQIAQCQLHEGKRSQCGLDAIREPPSDPPTRAPTFLDQIPRQTHQAFCQRSKRIVLPYP